MWTPETLIRPSRPPSPGGEGENVDLMLGVGPGGPTAPDALGEERFLVEVTLGQNGIG